MHIIHDDLSGNEIRELLEIHFAGMLSQSPRGACHFLDIEALKGPTITFWSVRDNQSVAGCGALKELDLQEGEIKSMRTHPDYLRQGVAGLLLDHIIMTAKARGYRRVSLEPLLYVGAIGPSYGIFILPLASVTRDTSLVSFQPLP